MSQEGLKGRLQAIKSLVDQCLAELGVSEKKLTLPGSDVDEKQTPSKDIFLRVVNKIGDCDECDAIQKQVINKRSAEAKILLCFYVSYKYFENEWLTSGDIEKITSELGVKIHTKNVSNYLTTFRPYLESGAIRRKGQPTPYRLNKKGVERFEEIINAEKISKDG